jgi:hypothetical protein
LSLVPKPTPRDEPPAGKVNRNVHGVDESVLEELKLTDDLRAVPAGEEQRIDAVRIRLLVDDGESL